jgi:sarcosine oxidase subunit delta
MHGDAAPTRPDAAAPDALARFADYIYLRDNPAGTLSELCFHAAGCHAWLVVTRDTRTHEITGVEPARNRHGGAG